MLSSGIYGMYILIYSMIPSPSSVEDKTDIMQIQIIITQTFLIALEEVHMCSINEYMFTKDIIKVSVM